MIESVEEAAKGRAGKSYYVAVLKASDLAENGIECVSRPEEGDPGHAELPQLTYDNRKQDETLERQHVLVEKCLKVEGPFLTPEE